MGAIPVPSVEGFRYYVIFVDDHSRFTWFYPLRNKSDFASTFTVFLNLVQTQFSTKLNIFQSDGGKEFVNNRVKKLLDENGTLHRMSCPYTPQQNGRAERKHRHVVDTGLALLFNSHTPPIYWVHAFTTAVYIINRLPSKVLKNKSPFEQIFSQSPDYANFRTFGCRVYPYLRNYAAHKLSPRSLPCIFLGYCTQYKGFECHDLKTSRVYVTRHARFDEANFPFKNDTLHVNLHSLPWQSFSDDSSTTFIPSQTTVTSSNPNPTSDYTQTPIGPCCDPPTTTIIEPTHLHDSITSSSPVSTPLTSPTPLPSPTPIDPLSSPTPIDPLSSPTEPIAVPISTTPIA